MYLKVIWTITEVVFLFHVINLSTYFISNKM